MYLCKSGFSSKFKVKNNCKSQNLQSVASSRITLNHQNIIKSILQPLESVLTL